MFTQFYVNSPICSPSRTAVTTGQYPSRWGITSYIDSCKANANRGMKDYLDLSAPSVARNIQAAGYTHVLREGSKSVRAKMEKGDISISAAYESVIKSPAKKKKTEIEAKAEPVINLIDDYENEVEQLQNGEIGALVIVYDLKKIDTFNTKQKQTYGFVVNR